MLVHALSSVFLGSEDLRVPRPTAHSQHGQLL